MRVVARLLGPGIGLFVPFFDSAAPLTPGPSPKGEGRPMRPENEDRHPARVAFSRFESVHQGREPVPFLLNCERSEREPL